MIFLVVKVLIHFSAIHSCDHLVAIAYAENRHSLVPVLQSVLTEVEPFVGLLLVKNRVGVFSSIQLRVDISASRDQYPVDLVYPVFDSLVVEKKEQADSSLVEG